MLFAYTDIVGISDYDYKVDLFLTSKEKLNLWGLGYQYEDFLFQLYKLRNELMLKYLLMEESLLQAGFEAQYTQLDPNGQTNQTGNCEIRLYDTALVVLPQKSEPIRLPYCYITNVNKQDYKLTITNEFLEKTELTRLGQNFDPLAKALSDAINKMILRTQQNIKELIPEATPITINKLATLMKDGRAAKRKEIEQQSPDFWRRLTKKIDEAGITTEYEFLNSLAAKDQVCVGIKRGLMGDLTGTYIWMLFPTPQPRNKQTKQHNSPRSIQHPRQHRRKQRTTNRKHRLRNRRRNQPNPRRRTKTRHNRSNLLLQSNRKKRILTNQRRRSDQRTRQFHQKHQPIHDRNQLQKRTHLPHRKPA